MITTNDSHEFDRSKIAYQLVEQLEEAEKRANYVGWITAEDVEKELEDDICF